MELLVATEDISNVKTYALSTSCSRSACFRYHANFLVNRGRKRRGISFPKFPVLIGSVLAVLIDDVETLRGPPDRIHAAFNVPYGVPEFTRVAAYYPRVGVGILASFLFENQSRSSYQRPFCFVHMADDRWHVKILGYVHVRCFL